MSNITRSTSPHPSEPVKRKRNLWLIISAAALLIVCLCIAAAAALLVVDPFGWGLIGRLFGGYDAVARTVPADADVHVSIDMLKLMSKESRALIDVFAAAGGNAEIENSEQLSNQLDQDLLETYGVTFTDDVLPWVGQYAGFSVFEIDMEDQASVENWVISIETRNQKAADDFIAKVMGTLSDQYGSVFITTEHNGVQLFSLPDIASPMAMARSKNIVFISPDAASIQRSIDASGGDSLAKNPEYRAAIDKLPSTRMITAYLSAGLFNQITSMAGEEMLGGSGVASTGGQSNGISLSLIEGGVQLDIFSIYDLETLPPDQKAQLALPGAEGKLAEQMPQDVVLLLTGKDLNRSFQNLLTSMEQSAGVAPGEVHESMQLLEDQIGMNPEQDLFPFLDQEWVISLVQERNTILSEEMDLPLGLFIAAESSSTEQLRANLDATAAHMGDTGMIMVSEETVNDMTLYEASIFMMDAPLFSFGLRGNLFMLGTDPQRLQTIDGATLSQSPTWQNTWKKLPDGMSPILYMDFQGLVRIIPDIPAEDTAYLRPIQAVALAGSPLEGNSKHWMLMVTIDTP